MRGSIRNFLFDAMCVVAIFAVSAVPLFAGEACYLTQDPDSSACQVVSAKAARPHYLFEYPSDGAPIVINYGSDLAMCRDMMLDAFDEAKAAGDTETDFGCFFIDESKY